MQQFNVGDIPLRLGGIKSYDTPDDEVVLEIPILWGSDAKVRIIGSHERIGISNSHCKTAIHKSN